MLFPAEEGRVGGQDLAWADKRGQGLWYVELKGALSHGPRCMSSQ